MGVDRPATDTAYIELHVDEDSPCSLCRRCQLRKRLAKKAAEMQESKNKEAKFRQLKISDREEDDEADGSLTVVNDYREKVNSGSKSKKKKGKRNRGRKKICNGNVQPEVAVPEERLDEAVEDPQLSAFASEVSDQSIGSNSPTETSENEDEVARIEPSESSIEDVVDAIELNSHVDLAQDGKFEDVDDVFRIPRDVQEEIDREVENFRIRLARASATVVGDKLKPVFISPSLEIAE
ncbi:hypothetical protein NDN08_000205 [Rhodosorus marinus]|uniref:Uncharacterized protein n=1 Tax=Rhodosorus marinus TaxID=101924 RepID=A0AAV8UEN3_9RHOD|nr:hypothetical protein NDN08_000205 [Rhodosorus marinus]